MAKIKHIQSGQEAQLPPVSILGRAREATLRLDDDCKFASRHHAQIRWDEGSGVWELRDLNSSNGTFCDGVPLGVGGTRTLKRGAHIGVGQPDGDFELVNARPPGPWAREDNGRFVDGGPTSLYLPSRRSPVIRIGEDGVDGWRLEGSEGAMAVTDGQHIEVAGRGFTLFLPEFTSSTKVNPAALSIDKVELVFHTTPESTAVSMVISTPSRETRLRPQRFCQLLMQMARWRLDDRAQGLPEAECGWREIDDIMSTLHIRKRQQVYVLTNRARMHIERAGIVDAERIIERPPGMRGLARIGVSSLRIY